MPTTYHTKPPSKSNLSLSSLSNTGYRWREQDPVLVEVLSLVDKSGLTPEQICQKISTLSKSSASVSPSTIKSWQSGQVRRPTNWCIDWVAAACGWSRAWRRIDGKKG